jgi:hypothetical protein
VIGPLEDLAASIAAGRIAPQRLVGGAYQSLGVALRAGDQTAQGQVEGAGQADQERSRGAGLAALDLADHGA